MPRRHFSFWNILEKEDPILAAEGRKKIHTTTLEQNQSLESHSIAVLSISATKAIDDVEPPFVGSEKVGSKK